MELSVPEAAESLALSRQRVLRLIHDGELPARRIGGRWVVVPADIEDLRRDRASGRPMAGRIAWGLLDLVGGGEAPWLSAPERSRLRARLRSHPPIDQVGHWVRRRSEILWLRGHPAALPRLLAFEGAVPAGASAPGHDIVDPGSVEVYLREGDAQRALDRLSLRPVGRAESNAVVRVPQGHWPFDAVPFAASVALDLWESRDERSHRTARRLYSGLLERNWPTRERESA